MECLILDAGPTRAGWMLDTRFWILNDRAERFHNFRHFTFQAFIAGQSFDSLPSLRTSGLMG